jgi:single-stranded DNA-binding protein
MSAAALITGSLIRAPELMTSKAGKPYVTATVKVAADNAVDLWRVVAFSDSAQSELLRLGEGDKISVQGGLKIEPYTGRDGQSRINRTVFVHHAVALRQPPRQKKPKASPSRAPEEPAPISNGRRDFGDDIPF